MRGSRRLLEALDAVDCLLNHWIEALHAEAGAGNARLPKSGCHFAGERAGIDLDRDLGLLAEGKPLPHQGHEAEQLGRLHDGRRAPAEMNMAHRQGTGQALRDEPDLAAEDLKVVDNRSIALGDRGVAAAVPAHRAAERHVEIEGGARPDRQGRQPVPIGLMPDGVGELRCCRIARVAGEPLLAVARSQIVFHGAIPYM